MASLGNPLVGRLEVERQVLLEPESTHQELGAIGSTRSLVIYAANARQT